MQENVLSIGDKIELFHYNKHLASAHKQSRYVSQLLDLIGDNKASIAMPIAGRKVVVLEIGEVYTLCFYTKRGLYQCRATVTERYRASNMFIATVEFISDLEKKQRRQYYRLQCVIDCKYHIMSEEEVTLRDMLQRDNFEHEETKKEAGERLEEISKHWEEGVITDISGGGLRFNSKLSLINVEKVIVSFSLFMPNGLKVLKLISNVVESKPIPNRATQFEHRVEFNEIGKEERELIVKYVFEEERKQRRKEKGLN